MTYEIYKSWGLYDSNSARTLTRTSTAKNQKDRMGRTLNHKHSHSPQVQLGMQQHLSIQILAYYILLTITIVAAVVYRVRPTEVI